MLVAWKRQETHCLHDKEQVQLIDGYVEKEAAQLSLLVED
jgi:hypothetical protein